MTFEVGDRVTGAVKDLEFPYEVGIVRRPTLLDRFRFNHRCVADGRALFPFDL